MLTQIYVKNFILIDNITLSFDTGMSTFIGETGAGKSLLIDALGILKGDRVSGSMVKRHEDKAIIEGTFSIKPTHTIYQKLVDDGYDLEDEVLIITREFTKDGKSIARMNHRQTTVSYIREIVSSLIDIHSQHDTQYLLNNRYHLPLLDAYCHHSNLLHEVANLYHDYKKAKKALDDVLQHEYKEDDLDFLTFQLNEIDEANIQEHELEELEASQKKMLSYEKINTRLLKAIEWLDGTQGTYTNLYEAYREVDAIADDQELVNIKDTLLDTYYVIEEKLSDIHKYLGSMEFDERQFHAIQERIFQIHKLYRKYGNSYDSLQQKRNEIEQKIDSIIHRQDFIDKQEKEVNKAYERFYEQAKKLHAIRVEHAQNLEREVICQLQDLHLPNAQFCIQIQECDANKDGIDKVEFFISMNKGEPLKPLQKVASGGELSRLMLGLKTIFSKLQGIQTIIFDEIDTGVSGSVAFSIGKKMQSLSTQTQVFCVTHLAQVAACAHHHYLVKKEQKENETKTNIQLLNDNEVVFQLASIASDSHSESALLAAKELYEKAHNDFI